jgi:hypothetical protein
MQRIFGNWRTTILGQAAAGLNLVANGMSWKSAALSVVLSLWGLIGKDAATGSAP